ncbi:MAG: hypothetical protein MSIBF_03465 [Candidatus Altiarchaeales archaeon IMC4]|nr:MAG: hypothetical protein MSIBF_03465 [Candidatus Altiarchaeales archaeon IMC4]
MLLKNTISAIFAVVFGAVLYAVFGWVPVFGGLLVGWFVGRRVRIRSFYTGAAVAGCGFFLAWDFFLKDINIVFQLILVLDYCLGILTAGIGSRLASGAWFASFSDLRGGRRPEKENKIVMYTVCQKCGTANPKDDGVCAECGGRL